jgi:hypothetical protein
MTNRDEATPPRAKDLTWEDPRPMDATLAGYPWLPRMIDKARAADAGLLGGYYRYPCPIDLASLALLGIDAQKFCEIACKVVNDEDAVDELRRNGADLKRLAEFDPVRLNLELHATEG